MLVKLGDSMVDPDEVVYAKPGGDDMSIEVLFKSHGKLFGVSPKAVIKSKNREKDIEAFLQNA